MKFKLLCAAFLLATSAFAQVQWGLCAGFNLSNLSDIDKYDWAVSDEALVDYKLKPGFSLGVSAYVPINNTLGIETGLHFFGIFSIFNASHLQNMEVARIPLSADAPCRLAGNVNMTSKEVLGGQSSMITEVGLISSQGTYSLPIRENAGLVLSVRKSYLGALYSPWLKSDELNIDYEFCDFNATTNISLGHHDNVRLTLYYGNDDAYLNMTDEGSLYKLRWSNNLVAINWIHTTRNRKQVRTTAYTSAFGNKFELNFGADRFLLPSSITEMGCGVHASLNVADIGAEYQYDKIEPQHATTNSLNFESSNVAKQYTHMLSAYAQTGEQLCSFVRLGIKTYSYFANDGYNNTSVAPFAKIIWYGEKCLASVCYSKRYQYLHRLGFSTINWPTEFYCATNKYTPLQTSYTIAVQGSIYVFDDKWKIEADLYLMQLRGQATYIGTLMDIAMSGISPSHDIIEGKGRSWGGQCTNKSVHRN